ncbi:PREDICTED: mitochondrial import inner membrane translocase subunit Tim23-like [Diuraphis noxia]|uniref:mitochondrial import inner membrane translocase subunit Tim23-like n=1 Tax=Diuraphis noxia TaxID=143948 RepID=UPI0007639D19|nr:PREDICTED: mitochondrial import inner membrane translocase subunit Tim23-like [Diuraphis noxia]
MRMAATNMLDLNDDNKGDKKGVLIPSPYLKHGSQVQHSQSEYIFIDGVGSKQRGRFEMCFIEIGTWYSVGATIGIMRGVHCGMKIVLLNKQTGTYNRTLLLNSVLKHGSSISEKFGTLVVYYSIFGIILEKTRGQKDDIYNNIIAGTSTGLLYRSTSGLRSCGIGGLLGFSLTAIYSLISSRIKMFEDIRETIIHFKN